MTTESRYPSGVFYFHLSSLIWFWELDPTVMDRDVHLFISIPYSFNSSVAQLGPHPRNVRNFSSECLRTKHHARAPLQHVTWNKKWASTEAGTLLMFIQYDVYDCKMLYGCERKMTPLQLRVSQLMPQGKSDPTGLWCLSLEIFRNARYTRHCDSLENRTG